MRRRASTVTSTGSAPRSTRPSAPRRSSAPCATSPTATGGSVIDDIVPGHTGKGADFRLAEMGFKDYPGIYHMVEIPPEDWSLLPDVPDGVDSANLDAATEHELAERGYIIGALQRVIFYTPGVKETNWSATAPVIGPDGHTRRWVYLHYFKQGQPSINWLDPTFAGMRLVIGDALHSLGELGTSALRLDANGFLGVEKSAEGLPAWSEGHPPLARGEPHHRRHGAKGRWLHVPGAQPHHRRHPRHGRRRGRPVVRLHRTPRLPPRPRDRTDRVPAACARPVARARCAARAARPRAAEPRRTDLRAAALGDAAQRRPSSASAGAR
jgi:hypothetical protein